MTSCTLPLLKPTLYTSSGKSAVLLGGRCECGHVFFPMQTFGCERCGKFGDALQPIELKGRGTLRCASTVHVHADDKRAPPFVIGMIALDDGPIVRTLILDAPIDHEAPGTLVEAVLVPVPTEQGDALDLRFRAVSA
jgi:uncharacterized OB-fold protein